VEAGDASFKPTGHVRDSTDHHAAIDTARRGYGIKDAHDELVVSG
jgi:hypothetical protein